jgi:hypothetical protein
LHKARVSKFDRILDKAPAMFSAAQLRVFLRALVSIDPYAFDDVAEHLAANDENNQQTSEEILLTALYEAREQEHEAKRLQSSLSPRRGPRLSNLSLERFRSSTKYLDRPAAADIAFCVAAFANGMTEDRIGCALEDDYLSRDPSPSKRAAYIRRTMAKARRWAER